MEFGDLQVYAESGSVSAPFGLDAGYRLLQYGHDHSQLMRAQLYPGSRSQGAYPVVENNHAVF